jgi:hypothetical protein
MASTLKVTDIQHPSSGVSALTVGSDNSVSLVGGALSPQTGFKNRIINGAMTIDQRNAGASVTPAGTSYALDRWVAGMSLASKFSVQQNAGSVTPPVGFTNYLGCTSLSAYSVGSSDNFVIVQRIEGYNVADLGWGSASAQTVTVSFWVRSSLTGTFGGSLRNADNTRSYPFSYTISSANTWEQKSITIAGDTTGTWLTTTGIGIAAAFSLGTGTTSSGTAGAWTAGSFTSATGATSVVGTNGATWYVTGVQLEKGSTATPFEFRSIGQELALCQRYYESISFLRWDLSESLVSNIAWMVRFAVPKRATPTVTKVGTWTIVTVPSQPTAQNPSVYGFNIYTGGAAGNCAIVSTGTEAANASAEL